MKMILSKQTIFISVAIATTLASAIILYQYPACFLHHFSSKKQIPHLWENGTYEKLRFSNSENCSENDSISIYFQLIEPFGGRTYDAAYRINTPESSLVTVQITDPQEGKLPTVDRSTFQMKEIASLHSLVSAVRSYNQDSTSYLIFDDNSIYLTLCDRKKDEAIEIDMLAKFMDTPASNDLLTKMGQVIIHTHSPVKKIDSLIQMHGLDLAAVEIFD